MFEWTEQQRVFRDALRKFCEKELEPHLDALDTGALLPYPFLRELFATFGLGDMALAEFRARQDKDRQRREAAAAGEPPAERPKRRAYDPTRAERAGFEALPVVEISRYAPGVVTALGVSFGLTANAILARGTPSQRERFVPDLLTLKTIGAWAITEPGSGSDAFGAMRCTARPDGDGFVLNGQKTFITNGPYADTIVLYAKFDDGRPAPERPVVSFVLDGETPGLTRSPAFRKMGMHASPTGDLFLEDVRVGRDRLLGEDVARDAAAGRAAAKATFGEERIGVASMALGMIERCLELSLAYARERVQFGRPIGDFQLIQEKLARMAVARQNVENILFRSFEMAGAGRRPTLAEASAAKLYCGRATTEVCLEAVQLHGGYGYMSEYRVEQLARDAKVLQIFGGTDEIQIGQIARDLLSRG